RRREGVEGAVVPDEVVMIARALAVVAQPRDALGDVRPPGDDGAGLAGGAEVLGRIEAERGGIAERPRPAAAAGGAVGLGRVLQQRHAASGAPPLEALHVGQASV